MQSIDENCVSYRKIWASYLPFRICRLSSTLSLQYAQIYEIVEEKSMDIQESSIEQGQAKPIVSNQFEIKYHLFAEKLNLNSLFLSARAL